ncbi:MAG: PH domain-containing protein [Wenzhouxiangellaceae bacterium]|nr:PH domain-containing protein [Wenzhouxiangellaceae bacterium]
MSEHGECWTALPIAAVGALYLNGIQRLVRENLVVLFGAGTGFAVSDALGWYEFALIGMLVLAVGLLVAVIYHRRFRYLVADDHIRVRQGLFEQTQVKVRFDRVQNVSFSQPVYLKPFGLTRLGLETPGAAQTEVRLPGIRTSEAERIHDLVAACQDNGAAAVEDNGLREPEADLQASAAPAAVFSTRIGDLFGYGLTSNQVWILLALFGAPVSNWIERRSSGWVSELTANGLPDEVWLEHAPWLLGLAAGGLIVALALALMLLSGLLAVIRFYDYRLTRDGGRLKSRSGWFDVREKTLNQSRLHSMELVQTAIGRAIGHWYALGHQAGAGHGEQGLATDRRFLIPGIHSSQLETVAAALVGHSWQEPDWQPIDRRFRNRLWARIVSPIFVSGLVLWMLPQWSAQWPAAVLMLASLLLGAVIHQNYKRWGFAFDGTRVQIRRGLIGQRISSFEIARCQQFRLTCSPYQRRHGLASLVLRLPHGDATIPYLQRELADDLANQLLFQVEQAQTQTL